jgi:hypothetical protein
MTDPLQAERQTIEQHTVRSTHGPRRYGDGLPEFGSDAYAALSYEDQLRVAEARAGIFRDPGDGSTGGVPTVQARPYSYDEHCPIDRWR